MARLSKPELLNRVLDAISESGTNFFVQNASHPFRVSIWDEYQTKVLRIFIWNISSGGPSSVRPATEYRIQLTGIGTSLDLSEGMDTLLMGWSDEFGVFAAFEARRHQNFGFSPSIQINQKYLITAQQLGISFAVRRNGETVVCFAPDQFLNYALNLYGLHNIMDKPENTDMTTSIVRQIENDPSPETWDISQVDEPRQEIIETTRRWIRRRDFRGRILSAYRNRCAICHLQLNLVEAAHIVPVSVLGSRDSTNNGLCLCVLHHAAYDRGLVGVGPDYHVILNQEKLNSLRNLGLGGGENRILENVGDIITVPDVVEDRPARDNLIQGLSVRGWSGIE